MATATFNVNWSVSAPITLTLPTDIDATDIVAVQNYIESHWKTIVSSLPSSGTYIEDSEEPDFTNLTIALS